MINPETIKQLDTQGMLPSIDRLAKQVEHAWAEAENTTMPVAYKNVNKIVVFGMGGSILGADIIRNVFSDKLTVPLLIENNYHVPTFVDANTLVVLSSYSGTTEETLEIAKTIQQKTKKILVVTTGGELKTFKEQNNLPGYIINPTYNPCNQPRIAVGYAVTGLMRLLTMINLIKLTEQQINEVIHYLDNNKEHLKEQAIKTAQALYDKIPVYVGSEFLMGNLHVLSNQTNENGKNFSTIYAIPELNHHLMEGLGNPNEANKNLKFVLVESKLYHERVQKRFAVTKQVIEKNKLEYTNFITQADTKLTQSFEVLQWGSYVSFYLAMLNEIDPSPIPWVDYFKHALKA
ncbi:MAG: SIS domain-containing protein [Patescibacteria group bacterium]|jgi:glucose/mannose-6-phosphate isomerase